MAKIRALTDLRLNGIAVPHNRVAEVDDDVAAGLIESGQATDDEKAVETALIMNPETIELATPGGKIAKPTPPPEDPEAAAKAEAAAAAQTKKGAKPAAEEESGSFGE